MQRPSQRAAGAADHDLRSLSPHILSILLAWGLRKFPDILQVDRHPGPQLAPSPLLCAWGRLGWPTEVRRPNKSGAAARPSGPLPSPNTGKYERVGFYSFRATGLLRYKD